MKTSSSYSGLSTRVWVKVLAGICIANAVLLTGVDAACVDLVSGGDKGVGISAFDDASCVNGGIGCFQIVCRYCKTRESVQASQFVSCPGSTTAAPAQTTAAPVATTAAPPVVAPVGACADRVPGGDKDVGISAVSDLSCKNGGVGCFAEGTCRFCKTKETTQAGNFLACSGFASASATPVTVTPQVISTPSTSAPAASTPVVNPCADTVAAGDKDAGISAVSDLTCKNGGIGCFAEGTCRYCKTKETSQAGHFLACSGFSSATSTPVVTSSSVTVATLVPGVAPVGSCADKVPGGDKDVGISAVSDLSCKNGGVGCFADGACRYCKTKDTPQACHLLACSGFMSTV